MMASFVTLYQTRNRGTAARRSARGRASAHSRTRCSCRRLVHSCTPRSGARGAVATSLRCARGGARNTVSGRPRAAGRSPSATRASSPGRLSPQANCCTCCGSSRSGPSAALLQRPARALSSVGRAGRSRQRRWRQDAVQTHVVRQLAVVIGHVERVTEHHLRARRGARVAVERD